MNKSMNKLKAVMFGMAYGLMLSAPVHADDTEIYVNSISGSQPQSAAPNMLFILDTSGSMRATIVTRVPYDSATNYTGCFSSSRYYTNADAGGDVRNRYCRSNINNPKSKVGKLDQFNPSSFVCDAATAALANNGFFIGTLAQFRGSTPRWRSVTKNNVSKKVECRVDGGIHGDGGAATWATNNSTGWSSNEASQIKWDSVGESHTVYTANYLNYLVSAPTTSQTRLQVMQETLANVIDSSSGINIGLMRFDVGALNSQGGMVVSPMGPVDTSKADFITELNAMKPLGGTPLSEVVYEATLYYQGKNVDYGNRSTEPAPGSLSFGNLRAKLSHPDSRTPSGGSRYKSPITNECQKNNIVLLSDGAPSEDNGFSGTGGDAITRRQRIGLTGTCSGNCLDEIAATIGSNDQSSTVDDKQVISTYTIGLDIDHPLLSSTAQASKAASGAGEYFTVSDAGGLAEAFNKIVRKALDTEATFSSPAVSVNAFNRSTHLDDLYFTLFKPTLGTRWQGNLKKYQLKFEDVDVNGELKRLPFIADATGARAIENGFFSTSSKSFWTDGAADGKVVTQGGALGELVVPDGSNGRQVFTYTDTYTNDNGVFRPATASALLSLPANRLSKSNTDITEAMLNITGLPNRINDPATPRIETLLDWAAGIDVFDQYGVKGTTTDARLEMGDPLHSEPALIQYGETSPGVADLVAYVATNDGYLHAIDADDGKEIFSFVPKELLPNLNILMDNEDANKTYGLDGNVVAWINDVNNDGTISGPNEHVYLYIGMRRGGKDIYSFDVTDRENPVLRWVIKGGVGDYANLAQTWSTVNVEKIKDGATEKTVLIFGGGYDVDQDTASVRSVDNEGNSIYIVDADTGSLLWSAGPGGDLSTISELQYSIPARVKPLDLSGDGLIDRLYAADMGGQIFRFDIDNNNGSALSGSITGGRIADLAGSADIDARRFYYPPDVALIAEKGKASYLALAIASGYRAHPLDEVIHDRIYLLKDKDVFNVPSSYTTLTEAGSPGVPGLYDATLNLIAGDGTQAENDTAKTGLANSNGWRINLDDEDNSGAWIGEKGLSEALILEGSVIVTTFTPIVTGTANVCQPQAGTGKVFFLDVLDASATFPSDSDVRKERHTKLLKSGIPPSPNVIITKGGVPTLCVGTECEAANFGLGVRKTYWYEVEK